MHPSSTTNLTAILALTAGDKHIDMINRRFACNNHQLMLQYNLTQFVARQHRYNSRQNSRSALLHSDQTNIEIRLRTDRVPLRSHRNILQSSSLLKSSDFNHSRGGIKILPDNPGSQKQLCDKYVLQC